MSNALLIAKIAFRRYHYGLNRYKNGDQNTAAGGYST